MSDYMEVYDYKPESFAGIKYAFTSELNWTGPNWFGGPRFRYARRKSLFR